MTCQHFSSDKIHPVATGLTGTLVTCLHCGTHYRICIVLLVTRGSCIKFGHYFDTMQKKQLVRASNACEKRPTENK